MMCTRYMCADYILILGSVKITEKPPFGEELLTWLTVCSLCSVSNCNFSFSHHYANMPTQY